MIKIDICDDEQLWIDKAYEITDGFLRGKKEFEFSSFKNAKSFLDKLIVKREYADIILLDIDIPDINGFEIAEKIREAYPDIILIFFTIHENYVFDSFRFQPFRYVRKSNVRTELELAVLAAIQVLDKRAASVKPVILRNYNEAYKVNLQDILYFEIEDRKCNVYLTDGTVIPLRKGIKEVYDEIGSTDFVWLHNGAAVNVRYIKKYSAYDVTMVNDARLIVSRRQIKSVKNAILNYWGDTI